METKENELRFCRKCGRMLAVQNFKKTRSGGLATVCNDCVTEQLRLTLQAKRQTEEEEKKKLEDVARTNSMLLAEFTPRELMEELARRGYEGKLTFTEVKTIDITNF